MVRGGGILQEGQSSGKVTLLIGTPDFVLYQKLRYFKKDISNWNREDFGKIDTKRNTALEELTAI